MKGRGMRQRPSGISLIESLTGMTLSLFVILCSLEFFGLSRNHFYEIKESQEKNMAAWTALDRIRMDVESAGEGLTLPSSLGLIDGIAISDYSLTVLSREQSLVPKADLKAGQTLVPLEKTSGVRKNRNICIFDDQKGEVVKVASVNKSSIALSSPLEFSYLEHTVEVLLIREVTISIDHKRGLVRRKVNTSSSQPLCEDVEDFYFSYDRNSNLLHLRLRLDSDVETFYETLVFPKNMALCSL